MLGHDLLRGGNVPALNRVADLSVIVDHFLILHHRQRQRADAVKVNRHALQHAHGVVLLRNMEQQAVKIIIQLHQIEGTTHLRFL